MRFYRLMAWTLLSTAFLSLNAPAGDFKAGKIYTLKRSGQGQELKANGAPMATIEIHGASQTLKAAGQTVAEISTAMSGSSFPRTITKTARLITVANSTDVSVSYVDVAPAGPIGIEATDSDEASLERWLKNNAISTSLKDFKAEFKKETQGRGLRKWYELSGRARDGIVKIGGVEIARFYTGYQLNHKDGSYKQHHRGKTLELADVITSKKEGILGGNLVSYRCGCHGFTEFSPKVAMSGFEYSIALDSNGDLVDWFGSHGALFRKPLKYAIEDASEKEFASVVVEYPDGKDFTNAVFRFFVDGKAELARAFVKAGEVQLELAKSSSDGFSLVVLDTLLAMMPTQVIRGDGIRDSVMAAVETMVDWIRLVEAPSAETLADVMTTADPVTSVDKVRTLLKTSSYRFKSKRNPNEAPPGVVCSEGGCKFVPEAR